ncbi:hypothetical protein BGZ63DRAFT_424972 [Mariannaea sp. PMI_226]|nr:hypothetical protein BGZ63DRAFT_424972 [Mariannaea sp. PMI_226]
MVLEQTITIGKQLFSIFKEAQGNYQDKKNEIKAERNISRSQTFDQSRAIPEPPRQYSDPNPDPYQYYYQYDNRPPRTARPYETGSEHGSHRSRRSRSVHSRREIDDYDTRSRHALTESNMKTFTEISATAPSRPSMSRAYTQAHPMDLAVSNRTMMQMDQRTQRAMTVRDPGTMVPRSQSATELVPLLKPAKKIDMNLAYGNIPPTWSLLDEAKCVHHSATATITHLQKDPDSAAAVALSLAELSSLVKKTSPAFLTLMKTASPAVFHLLASPHFLIGTTIAAGVTVVCFGGWKIVKRVKEQQAARAALAYESVPMDQPELPRRAPTEYYPPPPEYHHHPHPGAEYHHGAEYNAGVEEALIIDDDLSSIETWRRGIVPFGEDESADMELITPMADRVTKEMYDKDDFDSKSRRSTRTSKTHESHRSHKSHRSDRTRDERDRDSDRRSRRTESIADSERSDRSHRSKRKDKGDDTRSRRSDDSASLVLRPKSHRQSNNMLKALFKPKKERDLVLA